MTDPSETLDIEEAIARWEEIIARTEAGEIFAISVGGEPKVRLEPIHQDETSRQGGKGKSRGRIADDLDTPPDDGAAAFGGGPAKKLFVSFWAICLENLPEGGFTHCRITPADAKLRIERARKRDALLCLSDDDLMAPYRKKECDDHRALCGVLRQHHGITLSLRDFCGKDGGDDPLYFSNPLGCMRISDSAELLVVSCAYSFSGVAAGGRLAHAVEPSTVEFHLIASL